MIDTGRVRGNVIGAPIDALTWDQAINRISSWSRARDSRVVCICNAHSVVSARQDPNFAQVIREADMATPDGAPVAWMLRRLGHAQQQRINGPDLMWRYLEHAQLRGESVFFYGNTESTLAKLRVRLLAAFPALNIAGAISPPFHALTADEDAAIVEQINASGAGVVFVSLGCPKQERWMAEHRGRVKAVMIGVGAAFDFHAGTTKRAPSWMQNGGLEWLHRLLSEPRRLAKRYVVTNTLFILAAARQLIFRSK